MIGMELDLISEIYIHLLIEKGMRGGISYIAKRYSKADNKYMSCIYKYIQSYDVNEPRKVRQCLLYSGFKWLSQQKVDTSSENSPTGYILEIGLKYPDEL